MQTINIHDDITALSLSTRSKNCLRNADINTIDELLSYPEEKMITLRNMGRISIQEIRSRIQDLKSGTGTFVLDEESKKILMSQEAVKQAAKTGGYVTIFVDEKGAVVKDIPIEQLKLSARALNCLCRSQYKFASELVGLTHRDLMSMKNSGKKTAEEIMSYINKILISRDYNNQEISCIKEATVAAAANDLAEELYAAFGENKDVWLQEVLSAKTKNPEAKKDILIRCLYESLFVRATLKAKILQILEKSGHKTTRKHLKKALPKHIDDHILQAVLCELEEAAIIKATSTTIQQEHPSVVTYAAQIQNERNRTALQEKLKGTPLKKIGEMFGISRERARQLIKTALKHAPCFREDKYEQIFGKYHFTLDSFTQIFNEPKETYYYLEMTTRGNSNERKPLNELLDDHAVPQGYRDKTARLIYKQHVQINGIQTKKARPDLVRFFVKNYCKEKTDYNVFLEEYHKWLQTIGLNNDPALMLESRTYKNALNQCEYALWSMNSNFRYYEIAGRDFTKLLSEIKLKQYENTEISTLKLFREHPDLMSQYDIRDEYELHNLLKKICSPENTNIHFKKMPTVEIGTANVIDQLWNLLLLHAPISGESLANLYEKTYGVKAGTVRSYYLHQLDKYCYNGIYSVEGAVMTAEQTERMKQVMTSEFYSIQEIKRLYEQEYPNANKSLLNPYNLKSIGFNVYPGNPGYAVRNTYPTASDYFRKVLTQNDIVNLREAAPIAKDIKSFIGLQRKLRSRYDIIEFLPQQYINIRKLNKSGVTKKHLQAYCKAVAERYKVGEYFTTTSMLKEGFEHPLHNLGFDEWFYSSILFEDRDDFSAQRTGGTRIFLRGQPNVTLSGMLTWLLKKHRKINIKNLQQLLKNHYDVTVPMDKLKEIITTTDLYFDTYTKNVSIDHQQH